MSVPAKNVRLTARDLDLMTLLTRYGAATYPLLQQTVMRDRGRTSAYRQLKRLADVRLLEDPWTGPSNVGRPRDVQSLWVPTRSAYQLVASPLRYKPIPLNAVRHTLAVAQLGMTLESQGLHVLTDREIRHLAAHWRNNGGGPFPSHMPWIAHTEEREAEVSRFAQTTPIHMPDLVVTEPAGRRHAVEVELTMKNSRKASSTLASYAASGAFTSITYYLAAGSADERFRSLVATIPPGARPMGLTLQTLVRHY